MSALSQAMIALKQILERPRNFAVQKGFTIVFGVLIISAHVYAKKITAPSNLMERCCFVI